MDRSLILFCQACYLGLWVTCLFMDTSKLTIEVTGLMSAITMLGVTFRKLRDVHQDIKEIEHKIDNLGPEAKISWKDTQTNWYPN